MHPFLHSIERRIATLILTAAALLVVVFAVAPASASAAPPQQFHGAQMHAFWGSQSAADNARELDLLAAAGADSVRVDLGWASLETDAKGQYNDWYVKRVDEFMGQARARGIKVIVALINSPCWASTAPESQRQGCAGQWWNRGDIATWAPRNASDYADAAAWVAKRWRADMGALEVWNEPNDNAYFHASDTVVEYAKLVKATYGPVKAVAPELPVVVGAVSWSDRPYLERLYDQGIAGNYDGISIHPYNEWRDPNDPWQAQWKAYSYLSGVKWVRDLMVAKGDADKGLWLTEFGFSTCGTADKVCVNQQQQAQYTKDSFRIAAGWSYVRAAMIYNLRNISDTPNDRLGQFGLVNRDFTPKPAYDALKQALHEYYAPNAAAQPDASAGIGSGTGTGTRPGTGSGTGTGTGPVTVVTPTGGGQLTATRGVTRVQLSCKAKKGKRCRGRLRLRAARGVIVAGYSVPAGSLGEARFSIPRGRSKVTVKLTSTARRLVDRVGRLRVTAVVAPAASTVKAAASQSSFVLKPA